MVTSIDGKNVTWRNYNDNQLYTDQHSDLKKIMKRGGKFIKNRIRKSKSCPDGWQHLMPDGSWMCGKTHSNSASYKKSTGGLFVGKTHEEGGIPIRIMPRGEIAEVEDNEYLINAATVKKVGIPFLDKLNSTATPHYPASSGFKPGELGSVSKYRSGGRIMKRAGTMLTKMTKDEIASRKISSKEISLALKTGFVSQTKDGKLIFNKKKISKKIENFRGCPPRWPLWMCGA